jgi:branched-chain amino acid transport system substrate-binding protein
MSPLTINKRGKGWKLILCLLPLLLIRSLVFAQAQPEDSVLFREGEILLSRGEIEKALWRFKAVLTDFPQSPLSHEARFRMGICYTQLKRPKEAIRILKELFPTFLAPARMVQVFTLLGDNHLELKDPFSALQWYGKGLLIPNQPNEELKKKVKSIIDHFDMEDQLKQTEILYRGVYAGGYAKLKLAQMAKRRGNGPLAKRILTELEKEYQGVDFLAQAKDLSGSISSPVLLKYPIGIILPMSGIHQPFGERVLQAIRLALKEINSQGKTPLISLSIGDSKGNPAEAEKAIEQLVTKEKVIGIIGPLLSITSDKASKKARQLKVPILILSQKEPLAGKGEFVFQNSITPSDQIRTLVGYAIKELELRTFAVFYPDSPYGLHFRNLFIQEATRRGGRVLGVVSYQEDQTDFSQEIKTLFKIRTMEKEDSKRKKHDVFKPGFSVDGLFIPDTHDRAGLILSQMAFYNVEGLTFLGTNACNGPGLLAIAGKSAEGTLFVDAFSKRDPSPLVVHFLEEFRESYQRDPETIEAIGYDTAKLLGEILLSKSISSPLELEQEIYRVQNFQGVSGLKGFGEDGKAIRTLHILRVIKGQIEQVPL